MLLEKINLGAGGGFEAPQTVRWNVCTRRVNKLEERCWFAAAPTLQPGGEVTETLQLPDVGHVSDRRLECLAAFPCGKQKVRERLTRHLSNGSQKRRAGKSESDAWTKRRE